MAIGIGGVNKNLSGGVTTIAAVNRALKEGLGGIAGVNREIFSAGLVLYDEGLDYADIELKWTAGSVGSGYDYEKQADKIYARGYYSSASSWKGVGYGPNLPIDLTDSSKISAEFEGNTNTGGDYGVLRFVISANDPTASTVTRTKYAEREGPLVPGDYVMEIDVSNLSGSYYVSIWTHGQAGEVKSYLKKWWLD